MNLVEKLLSVKPFLCPNCAKELPLGEALEHGWRYILAQNDHPDISEGVAAFLEKRPARWRDREAGDLD